MFAVVARVNRKKMNTESKEITIIGAGIIGIACAINLQNLGFSVTVIDKNKPGEGCSFGNAGVIAPCAMVPVNTPGFLKAVPSMLLDPLGPLSFSWKYLPKMLPWLFSYLKYSHASKSEQIVDSLAAITVHSLEEHKALAGSGKAAHLIHSSPYLYLYESEADLAKEEYAWDLRKSRGISACVLKGNQVQQFDPAIDSRYKCAVVMKDGHGFTSDPSKLVKALASDFQDKGGKIIQATVQTIKVVNHKPESLVTNVGTLPFQRLVIAAGAFSAKFADQLGEHVPLEAERGYHITVKNPGVTLRYPMMNSFGKFVITPMEAGLRFAGLVEFGGLGDNPNFNLTKRLLKHAKKMFPDIDLNTYTEWMGHRPALPDSLPIIGQSSNFNNTFYAFGHHHIGLTAGPKTGRILAELIVGQTPSIDLSPYSIRRFIRK
jgi:D-amino-acid dehydrogenase